MTRKILTLLIIMMLLAVSTPAFTPQMLTMDSLKKMRTLVDNTYYFIIINPQIKNQLVQIISSNPFLSSNQQVKIYETNCNDGILQACSKKENLPIIALYNKGIIVYSKYSKSSLHSVEDVIEWMETTIISTPVDVDSLTQIEKLISEEKQIYILLADQKQGQQRLGYHLLAKQFPFIKFAYLKNVEVGAQLNLTAGNLTYYFDALTEQNRKVYQHSPRLDIWKQFVYESYLNHVEHIQNDLPTSRFPLQPYQGLVLLWDTSVKCWGVWRQLMSWKQSARIEEMELPENLVLKKFPVRQEQIKLAQLLQIYYHLRILNTVDFPLILYIDNGDQNTRIPTRYIQSLNLQNPLNLQIKQFMQKIQANQIKPQILDAGVYKKNGFYGKGSQKLVQKLSYTSYQSTIKEVNSKNKHYIVMITAFDFQCSKCSEFYTDFRKLASYMSGQREDIVFGVIDMSTNQVDEPKIANIPDLLLYKAKTGEVVRNLRRYSFEGIMDFINDNAEKMQLNDL